MRIRLLALLSAFAFAFAANVVAQTKPRIEKAADLPRFSYKIEGNVEDVIRDDAKFTRFAADVRRDAESVLRRCASSRASSRNSITWTASRMRRSPASHASRSCRTSPPTS